MPNYRRVRDAGGTFFFTVVTEGRAPILTTPLGRECLSNALRTTLQRWPVTVRAMVLLPDHLHAIWTMPEDDVDYSTRWSEIKKAFVREYLAGGGEEQPVSESRIRNHRRGIWQRRFWEHMVRRDEFEEIAAYIHFNPVKHGLVRCPHEWEWSTFHQWVRDGKLSADWECVCDGPKPPRSFGDTFDQCE